MAEMRTPPLLSTPPWFCSLCLPHLEFVCCPRSCLFTSPPVRTWSATPHPLLTFSFAGQPFPFPPSFAPLRFLWSRHKKKHFALSKILCFISERGFLIGQSIRSSFEHWDSFISTCDGTYRFREGESSIETTQFGEAEAQKIRLLEQLQSNQRPGKVTEKSSK